MATRPAPQPPVRPLVIRRVRKVVAKGHHGGAWKVAYADFVTAMMAFFMLLWLLASPDKEKLKGLAEYFSPSAASGTPGESVDSSAQPGQAGARVSPGAPSSAGQNRQAASLPVGDASMRVMAEELRLLLEPASVPQAERQQIQMQQSREGLRVSLMDDGRRSLFRSGTAELNPHGRQVLRRLAGRLARSPIPLAIEGHTDSSGGQGSANWKLSADRALAARTALVEGGLAVDRFAEVVALASTRPVYPDQPERAENRLITIVLLNDSSPLPADFSFRN